MFINALQAYDTSAIVRSNIANTVLLENHTADRKFCCARLDYRARLSGDYRVKASKFI